MLEKKNFIIVAEIATRCVKVIVEGINEQRAKKEQRDKSDLTIEQRANELFREYPPSTHEVIRTRASDINDLQQGFPEFIEWDRSMREQVALDYTKLYLNK